VGQGLEQNINKTALNLALIEVKLAINRRLYEQKAITQEMYQKAQELIMRSTYSHKI